MTSFQEQLEQAQDLSTKMSDQIQLIRALANFHVNINSNGDQADLENQRAQIGNSVKELEERFTKLNDLWEQSIKKLQTQTAYTPEADCQNDLTSKFIKFTVPSAMQSKWDPDEFTGSLLVFFKDGKIESSSLIEKKIALGRQESPPENVTNGRRGSEKSLRVIDESNESFTILKSRDNSKFDIYFALSEPEDVIIKIYDNSHKLVRLIEKGFDEPGDFSVKWDGRDNENEELPKGDYACQLEIGNSFSELKTISFS